MDKKYQYVRVKFRTRASKGLYMRSVYHLEDQLLLKYKYFRFAFKYSRTCNIFTSLMYNEEIKRNKQKKGYAEASSLKNQ